MDKEEFYRRSAGFREYLKTLSSEDKHILFLIFI
ncbi:hypothetical protein LCGC14_2139970 [marine sediment metagenome]|uniref:Uncharacterized protein n=1 Tax=marine sediment metagenome TaxID=412755 RepID=A0A0F9GBU8_9ZZZZ